MGPQTLTALRPVVGEGWAPLALCTILHQPATNPGVTQSLWETRE